MALANMVFTTLFALLLLANMIYGNKDACAYTKEAKLAQEEALDSLDENNVVIVGRYVSKSESGYKFKAFDMWKEFNGDVGYLSEVIVENIQGELATECFANLVRKDRYYLVLRKDPTTGEFSASVPPLGSRRHRKNNHKEVVWEKMCAISTENCGMNVYAAISDPLSGRIENGRLIVEVYLGSYIALTCKVTSKHAIEEITWEKHGTDIAEGGETYRAGGLDIRETSRNPGLRDLMLVRASPMHNGDYKCVATDSEGNTAEYSVKVYVVGTLERSPCPSDHASYCMHGGTCMVEAGTPFCECRTGYGGKRCQEIGSQPVEQENEILQGQVQGLHGVVIALGVMLAVSAIVGLTLGVALRRARRQSRQDAELDSESSRKPGPIVRRSASDTSQAQQLLTSVTVNGIKLHVNGGETSSLSSQNEQARASPRPRLKAERE